MSGTDRPAVDVLFYQPWMGPLLAGARGTSAGGAETHMFLVARGLARRGLRVCVLTRPTDAELPSSVDGVDVAVMPHPRGPFPIDRLWRIACVVRAVLGIQATAIVQQNAEVDTGIVGLLARLRRRAFVWAAANVVDFDYAKIQPKRLHRLVFRLGVRIARQRVVQTAEQQRLCAERFGLPSTVVRNPCEPLPARSADPEVFLWAARLAPYKHPELYVELARAVPEARFRMVCVPTSESEHAELGRIRESALALPNLELLQARPRRELLELISSAVAVVNTADFEGMANVLLEAWAQGVPALVLTHDPDGVIAREGLGAFADGSFDRLAELARELWEHRGDQSQLAARCRAYVAREHSEDAVVDRWLEVLGFDATATTLP